MHFLAVFPFAQFFLACAKDEGQVWFSPSAKQHQYPCSGPPPVYRDLSVCHDWLVKKAIDNLLISMKGNPKCTFVNLLSPLGAQNKDLSATSQTLLTKVMSATPAKFFLVNISMFLHFVCP